MEQTTRITLTVLLMVLLSAVWFFIGYQLSVDNLERCKTELNATNVVFKETSTLLKVDQYYLLSTLGELKQCQIANEYLKGIIINNTK